MDWHHYIVSDPDILMGKATVRGTRISVELVLDDLASGRTEAQIASEYVLDMNAVRAAVDYASDLTRRDSQQPLARTA